MTAFKKTRADWSFLVDRILALMQDWAASVLDIAIFGAELWLSLAMMCFTAGLESLRLMLACCCCFCFAIQSLSAVRLTEEDKNRYQRLRHHIARPFDRDNPRHLEHLTKLAIVVFGEKMAKEERSDSPLDWESIGFQTDDPSKDIRGGGLVSIEHITAFVKKRPRKFWEIRKFVKESSYLFACASIRLTFFLIEYFGFTSSPSDTLGVGLDLDRRRSLKNLALFISRDENNVELDDPLQVNASGLTLIQNEMLELHFKTWVALLDDPSIQPHELLSTSEQFVQAAFASLIETKNYGSLKDFLQDLRSFDADRLPETYLQRYRH
jgi:hypothetical protein